MYMPAMLVLGRLSIDVVKDLLACICFVKSLHYAVLLLTSFDCLSFMNMYSGSLHGGGCPLSSLRESALAWLRFKKDAVLQDLVQGICFRRSIMSGLTEDDRIEVLLMSSRCL